MDAVEGADRQVKAFLGVSQDGLGQRKEADAAHHFLKSYQSKRHLVGVNGISQPPSIQCSETFQLHQTVRKKTRNFFPFPQTVRLIQKMPQDNGGVYVAD